MSDQSAVTTTADEPKAVTKPKRERTESFTVQSIARARLKRRGKSADGLADEMKVVRGMLRRSFADVVKAAPKSYGPKGSIKTEPHDRRPWGPIPATVAQKIVKG
jgi:hypothetical protein